VLVGILASSRTVNHTFKATIIKEVMCTSGLKPIIYIYYFVKLYGRGTLRNIILLDLPLTWPPLLIDPGPGKFNEIGNLNRPCRPGPATANGAGVVPTGFTPPMLIIVLISSNHLARPGLYYQLNDMTCHCREKAAAARPPVPLHADGDRPNGIGGADAA
jgi:hypothetical protein